MEVTIYHNPACSNSRGALALIREAGHEPRIVEYLKTPLSRDEIAALLACMNAPASEIVRSKEPVFGSLALEGAREAELVAALSEHPVLLNRPIVAVTAKGETVARLCRPPELVKTLLAGVE